MKMVLAVALGGALGASARYLLAAAIGATAFPWAILIVNVLGSFLMGVVAELAALKVTMPPEMRAFLTAGVLGGFTTFSAFSLDAALLIERRELMAAALYMGGSVVLSVGGLFAGLALVRSLP